ncbi:MAG: 3'-5' exonuclease [Corynebacterium sp.]|nr:3'-5' exonuclease [Corynebacterium sp.]
MNSFDTSRLLSFDVETTSVDPTRAHIVTSALVRIEGSHVDARELLANPGVPIEEKAIEVHGITNEYAQANGQPHAEVVAETVRTIRQAWAEGFTLIVFNAPFDLTILAAHDPTFTVDGLVVDPYLIDRALDRYRKGHRRLSDVSAHYSIGLEHAHEATSDALAAARIGWMQAQKWPEELTACSGEELMEKQAVWFYELAANRQEYLRKQGKDADDINFAWPIQPLR